MPEVLSQSQIDALLNAVRSGEKDLDEEPEAKAKDRSYRKYDFRSPRKFTKDRLKMLSGIFENYTRVINSRLNALLHTNCEVVVESVEEQRYYEFSNALSEGDVLSLARAVKGSKRADTPALIHLSSSVVLEMIDRMLGGEGTPIRVPSDYTYTDLELKLYESIVQDMVSVMGGSWENYIAIQFEYERTEVNPTLVQLIGLDEAVVIVDMKLQFPESSGLISIVLPGLMLTNIFADINRDNPVRKLSDEDNSEEIFQRLRDSSLDVVAQLGATTISLSDVYHLQVGDVLDLGKPKEAPVFLEIGGYQWFTGRMGTYKKKMAVKIEEICYQAERRSE